MALNEQLRIEKERRLELQLENMRLRGQNEIYRENDIWQKDQITRLSEVEAKLAQDEGLEEGEGENLAKSINAFAANVASNSNALIAYLAEHKKAIETDEAIDRDWSGKLQQLIDALAIGTRPKSATPTPTPTPIPSTPSKTVIVKTAGNIIGDWAIGYTGNLAAARTSALLDNPKDVTNAPGVGDQTSSVDKPESTVSTMASAVASATLSGLASQSTVLSSAASATLGHMPTTTKAIVTAVSIAFATMLLSGIVNLGGQVDAGADGQVRDEATGGTEDPNRGQEEGTVEK